MFEVGESLPKTSLTVYEGVLGMLQVKWIVCKLQVLSMQENISWFL